MPIFLLLLSISHRSCSLYIFFYFFPFSCISLISFPCLPVIFFLSTSLYSLYTCFAAASPFFVPFLFIYFVPFPPPPSSSVCISLQYTSSTENHSDIRAKGCQPLNKSTIIDVLSTLYSFIFSCVYMFIFWCFFTDHVFCFLFSEQTITVQKTPSTTLTTINYH